MQNLKLESDDVLVKLYEEGNDAAFDVLLERYKQVIYGYIFSIVNDASSADDVFQETFYKAIINIRSHNYVDSGKFQAWLMRIARNAIIDVFRRQRPTVEFSDVKHESRSVGFFEDTCESFLHNEETMNNLVQMIDQLPESQQEVVRMRLFDDLSFKEIADLTHCSINTALGRMRYAVLNMRKMAKQYEVCQ